jgi:hypothetical protein
MIELLESNTFWSALSAIFTLFALGGILVAIRQLRFDAWAKTQEIFTNPTFTKARGAVFQCLDAPQKVYKYEDALEVCRKMDEMAHLGSKMGSV